MKQSIYVLFGIVTLILTALPAQTFAQQRTGYRVCDEPNRCNGLQGGRYNACMATKSNCADSPVSGKQKKK